MSPAPCNGDSWGLAALAYEVRDLEVLICTSKSAHDAMLAAAARVAGAVKGGHLDANYAMGALVKVVSQHGRPMDVADLRKCWDYALLRADPRHPAARIGSDMELADRLHEWLDEVAPHCRGRSGVYDFAIAAAFASIAYRARKLRVTWTNKQIAAAVGIGESTVRAHTEAWQAFVVRVEKGWMRHSKATGFHDWKPSVFQVANSLTNTERYSLHKESASAEYRYQFVNGFRLDDPLTDPTHPRWQNRVMGIMKWRIYIALCEGPATAAQVARSLGLGPETVTKHLLAMEVAGEVVAKDYVMRNDRRIGGTWHATENQSDYDV